MGERLSERVRRAPRHVAVALVHVLLEVARLAIIEMRLVLLALDVLDQLQRLNVRVRVAGEVRRALRDPRARDCNGCKRL